MRTMSDRPTPRRPLVTSLVAILVPIVVVAVAILPFLTPAWVGFEQGRADSVGWTGFPEPVLRRVTDEILHDLVVGPPTFGSTVDGVPVLDGREVQHMRDVRSVFAAFALVAIAAAVALLLLGVATRPRTAFWRGLFVGGIATIAVVAVAGVVVVVAFDAAFEVFHRLFFAAGSYTFDPRSERLVQLFPDRFWFETSAAVGIVIVALAAGVAWLGRARSGPGARQVTAGRPAEATR